MYDAGSRATWPSVRNTTGAVPDTNPPRSRTGLPGTPAVEPSSVPVRLGRRYPGCTLAPAARRYRDGRDSQTCQVIVVEQCRRAVPSVGEARRTPWTPPAPPGRPPAPRGPAVGAWPEAPSSSAPPASSRVRPVMAARQPAGPGRDGAGRRADPQDAAPVGGEVVGMPSLGEDGPVGWPRRWARAGWSPGESRGAGAGSWCRVALGRSGRSGQGRPAVPPASVVAEPRLRPDRAQLPRFAARAVDNVTDALAESAAPAPPGRAVRHRHPDQRAGTDRLSAPPARPLKRCLPRPPAGAACLRGLRNAVDDLRHNGGMPSMVERDAFEVSRDLAGDGAVVDREQWVS
ncbi:hypothetical protein HBB16_00735 [Pseudonocardia sp. MCCB 268]|nr:hypothetical protein [Pseudonocardia cytotoxica]